MAQLELRLSSKIQKDTRRSEVLIRLYQGSKFDVYGKSEIFVTPNHFEYYVNRTLTEKAGIHVPSKTITATQEEATKKGYSLRNSGEIVINERIITEDVKYHRNQLKKINDLKQFIFDSYEAADKSTIKGDWLQNIINTFNHPDKYISQDIQAKSRSFFDLIEEYLKDTKYSDVREKNFRVLIRALKRYEMFVRLYDKKRNDFTLNIETIDKDTISDIESFLRNEHILLEEYPHIFKKFPATTDIKRRSPKPKPRGNNTICALFNKLRAFFNWCNDQKITQNRPFSGYNGVTSEKYGTPYYITLEERNQIAEFDLSEHPHLATQRDIFIFQCLIGCRVSDLLKMTEKNIINEAVEYIPHKTRDERPTIVRVPLNDRARILVDKYRKVDTKGRLFPFISAQKYNDDIKDIFRFCGITRFVTVLNPTTGEEEKRPINEVASSHMARRTFVGNLYKKVKDPNLVGSLSGHAEGSKAFARYREIDEEMKKELVNMIE